MKKAHKWLIIEIVVIVILTVYGCLEVRKTVGKQIPRGRSGMKEAPGEAVEPNVDDIVIKPDHAYTNSQIANAVYWAEGGKKASRPYGIKSIRCSSVKMYRKACIESIRNNRKRWVAAGKPGQFLNFMAKRYSPEKDHPLNKYWVRNVRKYLRGVR